MKRLLIAAALLILLAAGLLMLIHGGHGACQSGHDVKLGGVIETGGC